MLFKYYNHFSHYKLQTSDLQGNEMWENKQEMVKQTHPSAEGNCLSECICLEKNGYQKT